MTTAMTARGGIFCAEPCAPADAPTAVAAWLMPLPFRHDPPSLCHGGEALRHRLLGFRVERHRDHACLFDFGLRAHDLQRAGGGNVGRDFRLEWRGGRERCAQAARFARCVLGTWSTIEA